MELNKINSLDLRKTATVNSVVNCNICGSTPNDFNYRPVINENYYYCPNEFCKNYVVPNLNKNQWNERNK